jgi:chemotaxis protein methyltransferase CheR
MNLAADTFKQIAQVVQDLCGLVLGMDKIYLVKHRLEPLLKDAGLKSFEELAVKLKSMGTTDLREKVIDAITTQETSFFRDQHPFEAIRTVVLPELARRVQQAGGAKRLRIWSAACSTGQEPYTIAMLVRDYIDQQRSPPLRDSDVTILASDISNDALRVARSARYGVGDAARGLLAAHIDRHMERIDNAQLQVKQPVRKLVEFLKHNLTAGLSGLGYFDLILCRNVMIYFDEPTRRQICSQFYDALQDGGYLMIGAAENLYGIESRFKTVHSGATAIYQRPGR